MPIYEYTCTSCGHQFEKLVRIGASAPPCPQCESAEVRKLISASGFILKGGGWYKDHYGLKSDSGKSDSTSTESTSKKGDSGASGSGASGSGTSGSGATGSGASGSGASGSGASGSGASGTSASAAK